MPDIQIICTQCHKDLQPKDWTCPGCGAISDRLLFGTVKLKSLGGAGRNAYDQGYQDCVKQWSEIGSSAIRPETYHPTVGSENAYRAGWQNAADKLEAKGVAATSNRKPPLAARRCRKNCVDQRYCVLLNHRKCLGEPFAVENKAKLRGQLTITHIKRSVMQAQCAF